MAVALLFGIGLVVAALIAGLVIGYLEGLNG